MTLFLIYVFSFLPVFGDSSAKCPTIEVKTTVIDNDLSESKDISVVAKGGEQPYNYILINEKGKTVNEGYDFTKSLIKGVDKGTYTCVVSDRNGCSGKLKVEVK